MEQDLFKLLPSEIIFTILSKLAVQTIAISKCVCKSWRDLLKSDEFVKSHLSTSAAALAVLTMEENSSRCAVFELENVIDAGRRDDHHVKHVTNFNFPHRVSIKGSANGMLLLYRYTKADVHHALYVCNPISREYIELCYPKEFSDQYGVGFGFGASKITGQHKVVRVTDDSDCHHVYTIETGSWRRIKAARASFQYFAWTLGAFVNGNLHWLVRDSDRTNRIFWFDLETECFSTFSVPRVLEYADTDVSDVRGCLCLCNCTFFYEKVINLWLMKEYGDKKSWTKEYVINLGTDSVRVIGARYYFPIKVFVDADILMILDKRRLFYYSSKTKTAREIKVFDKKSLYLSSALLTPSFHSLKRFPKENVISF